MRYLFLATSFFFIQHLAAQKALPDSTMKLFTQLTCLCATAKKIDQVPADKGIEILEECAQSRIDEYEDAGKIKEEWLEDSVWMQNFYIELQAALEKTCPAFKTMMSKLEKSIIVPNPLPSVNEKYFLAKETMIEKGLEANANADNVNMKGWSAKNMNNAKIQMVVDIRYVLKDEEEAARYYKMKLQELSEGGELTTNNLNAFGASESKVYGANPSLLAGFDDLDMAQYNFVFRVKNIVAKVFVAASKKATYEEAVVFAKEAIAKIKAVK